MAVKTTQPTWSSPEDVRKDPKAGRYPNYHSIKSRSGHLIMLDDSNGAEHVTIQHRSGSMIQLMPNGCVQYVSHNGQYNIIFGENRVMVSGAQDIIVQGDASLRVEGNYNVNVKGDMNFNVNGDFNVTAQNSNQTIRGNVDSQAKNRTEKLEGSMTTQAQGSISVLSQKGMTLASSTDSLAIGAARQVGIMSRGTLSMKSRLQTAILSDVMVAIDAALVPIQTGAAIPFDPELIFVQLPTTPPAQEPDTPIYYP
jgi:hypothetical protein